MQCRVCNTLLTDDNWWRSFQKYNNPLCKKCGTTQRQDYRNNHREQDRAYGRKYDHQAKLKVFMHYSPNEIKCKNCGITDIRVLTLDHINGDGNKQRKSLNSGGRTYRWIVKNNFPPDYQILCMNCQWIKRYENNESSLIFKFTLDHDFN